MHKTDTARASPHFFSFTKKCHQRVGWFHRWFHPSPAKRRCRCHCGLEIAGPGMCACDCDSTEADGAGVQKLERPTSWRCLSFPSPGFSGSNVTPSYVRSFGLPPRFSCSISPLANLLFLSLPPFSCTRQEENSFVRLGLAVRV